MPINLSLEIEIERKIINNKIYEVSCNNPNITIQSKISLIDAEKKLINAISLLVWSGDIDLNIKLKSKN